jgi:hypothetical protein
MKFRILTQLLSTLLILCVPITFAQKGGGYRKHTRNYDPKAEVTVKGTVEEVLQYPGKGSSSGTHLMLKASEGILDVHVGPSWFLSQQKIEFAKGNEIEVTGSKVKVNGKDTVIAREIKKDEKVITLRNAQGIPEWAGYRTQ